MQYWNYPSFRPLQREIIEAIISGKDILALLPTGAGKTICYQLPIFFRSGLVLVISPLIALMEDQVSALHKRNITACYLHAADSKEDQRKKLNSCIKGVYRFLYLSPEKWTQTRWQQYWLPRLQLAYLVVDEAHCISLWGNRFRKAYRNIAICKKQNPNIQIVAFTATATKSTVKIIIDNLHLRHPNIFQGSFKRNNIACYHSVVPNKSMALLHVLAEKKKGSCIVYVKRRMETEWYQKFLKERGISSLIYHAGLPVTVRKTRQERWMSSKVDIIIATSAFGMGIDKKDVRLVVHTHVPENLESYYQEMGRAGRDGLLSYAYLFFYKEDIIELKRMSKEKNPSIKMVKNWIHSASEEYPLIGKKYSFDSIAFDEKKGGELIPSKIMLQLLERENKIVFYKKKYKPAILSFHLDQDLFYHMTKDNKDYDWIILLLKIYGQKTIGQYGEISLQQLALCSSLSAKQWHKLLQVLDKKKLLYYQPAIGSTFLRWLQKPIDIISDNNFMTIVQNQHQVSWMNTLYITKFVQNNRQCVMIFLCHYLGEKNVSKCDICYICVNININMSAVQHLLRKEFFKKKPIMSLFSFFSPFTFFTVIEQLRIKLDEGLLIFKKNFLEE